VIPVHYNINLTHLYTEAYEICWAKLFNLKNEYNSFNFHGESSTIINILQSTQYIKLHKLNIINWKITMIKSNGMIYVLEEYSQTSETYLLESQFPSVIFPGLYILKIEFLGRHTKNPLKNFFKSFYTNKENGIA